MTSAGPLEVSFPRAASIIIAFPVSGARAMTKRVLVTGSAGRIGQAAVAELQAHGHAVRGFDRVATPGLADTIVGEITDAAAVRRAMTGIDTLLHLAATPDDVDDPVQHLFPSNIVGVYHILEA